ncbi:MAG: Ig-like domain-containing protein [Candidatus Cloacimonadaceae bacterium]
MRTDFKSAAFLLILVSVLAIIFLSGCGSKQSPTGGKEDIDKLKILASIPAEFAEIDEQKVELTFSKTVDKASFLKGFYIYPPVRNTKIEYDANIITVKFLEALEKDTNYYIALTNRIKDVRGNALDKSQTLIYRHGKLQLNRVSGSISYEDPADNGLPVQVNLLSGDSLLVLTTGFTGNSYALDALNPMQYQLKAFIDKNLNGRYDSTIEPYSETIIDDQPVMNYNLNLVYADTVKAAIRTVIGVSNREYQIVMNKAVKTFEKLEIEDTKTKEKLRVFAIHHNADKITVLTAETDTVDLKFSIANVSDGKGNVNPESSITISANSKPDNIAPTVLSTHPRNGASVNNLQPVLDITFSEIIPVSLFKATLTETESQQIFPFRIIKSNSPTYQIQPESPLANYKSCVLTIEQETSDLSGNKLKEPYKLVFLPIIRD